MPVIQAFVDGKGIQVKIDKEWKDISVFNFAQMNVDKYRIKPEPKYRPFEDAEECWQEMQKHQPFGWLKGKEAEGYATMQGIALDSSRHTLLVAVSTEAVYIYVDKAMERYDFADGEPFGVKEEGV